MPSPNVFFSYARVDAQRVWPVRDALRALGVDVWVDADALQAGENWQGTISKAINSASALVFFISPASLRSQWTSEEVVKAQNNGLPVLPILLEPVGQLPSPLRTIQYLDATRWDASRSSEIAQEILRFLKQEKAGQAASTLPAETQRNLAEAITAQTRGEYTERPAAVAEPPSSVFVVHGHDVAFLRDVRAYLEGLGVTPIIMADVGGASRSLIERFFEVGGAASYAVCLISGDDYGASCEQYEEDGVADRALQFRARQNVILELGYFYGLLGWENVFVLEKAPSRRFPNFERPSDLSGVIFDRYDPSGRWRRELHRRLSAHGFRLTA